MPGREGRERERKLVIQEELACHCHFCSQGEVPCITTLGLATTINNGAVKGEVTTVLLKIMFLKHPYTLRSARGEILQEVRNIPLVPHSVAFFVIDVGQ